MAKTTELLERAVADVIATRPADGKRATPRQRAATDHAFQAVLKIVAPRIRHFIRQYGLTAHWEDAEQVCAIAVYRAINAYDPAKAMFTTFVNWQIRGELQGLRFRLMDDQRPSAKKVQATTISLHAVERAPDGEEVPLEVSIEDEDAFVRTESGAADHLAERTFDALMDDYVSHLRNVGIAQLTRRAKGAPRHKVGRAAPSSATMEGDELRRLDERIARDCELIRKHLFGREDEMPEGDNIGLTRERIRQIARRAAKVLGELAVANPRFGTVG